jgi:hypothetical protein
MYHGEVSQCDDTPVIGVLPLATLRERITRFASIGRELKGVFAPAHPPPWLVAAVDARGEWQGLRKLAGISDTPVLRADGSIWATPGYDERTGVLYEPRRGATFPPIPATPTLADARRAIEDLFEVVEDFPFEASEHRAAWIAALLTVLARFAFTGPSPLFLFDANIRGAGKTLLVQVIAHIVTGKDMPVASYSHETQEMRKRLTSLAIAGDRMILFDNLSGVFGNDALDRALTSTRWKDRILGKSRDVDLPLMPAWFATGNNVVVAGDTMRRIIHVRLDCLSERPEERGGFNHPRLLAWVDEHRGRFLCSALTVLSAYLKCGRPRQELKPFGSFEGWSGLVREALVWAGQPDPCLTRVGLAESADVSGEALGQFVAAWNAYDRRGEGFVLCELLNELYPAQRESAPSDEASAAIRAALENLVGGPPGRHITPRHVGNKLRNLRRHVARGKYFDASKTEYKRGGAVWRLHNVQGESSGGASSSGAPDGDCPF